MAVQPMNGQAVIRQAAPRNFLPPNVSHQSLKILGALIG
ncbi:hypothetical protein ENHAE0001_1269 [Enhydrobacter aerosaccus SK60]|nr:hypothetical protein ENHAE0001_1269 [Enhydrobacter aerosaccus SK60]